MKFRPNAPQDPEIDLTPLLDVVFLLLIFFMVSTTFKKDAALAIVLPAASALPVAEEMTDSIDIIITKSGQYFIDKNVRTKDGTKKPPEKLEIKNPKYVMSAIKKVSGGDNTMRVNIRADALSSHEQFVRVMDALGRLGFNKVQIATTPPPTAE